MKDTKISCSVSFADSGNVRDILNRSFQYYIDSSLANDLSTEYHKNDEEPLISGGSECIPR